MTRSPVPLSRKRRRAAIEKTLAPGYSTCLCCDRPWKFVKGHSTQYTEGSGGFPLCEDCWDALGTPEARLPYYRQLYMEWLGGAGDLSPPRRESYLRRIMDDWPKIEEAVMAGG